MRSPTPPKSDDKAAGNGEDAPAKIGAVTGSHIAAAVTLPQKKLAALAKRTAAKLIVSYTEFTTRLQVAQWLAEDKEKHTVDDGSSAAGRYYSYLKERTQAGQSLYTESIRNLFHFLLLGNRHVQDLLRSDIMVEQFELIDRIIREQEGYENDHGLLFKDDYNNKFLTETSHNPGGTGDIVAADPDAIVKLFSKRTGAGAVKGQDFPHILITSSHAQGETLKNVTDITHGIEALARDSYGEKGDQEETKELNHGFIDKGVKPGQTLTLYACDVEKTPMLNASALLKRILALKSLNGQPDAEFDEISPGAKRIAKLILKCMVEDPSLIDVNDPEPLSKIAAGRKQPILLRADAAHVANHFQLVGYSKGGNVVSDAQRYLVAQLTAKNVDGADIFNKHPESPTRTKNPNDCTMSERNVSNVMRGISCMALASIETGMSEHDIKHGVRRIAMNNKYDPISAHQNYENNPPYDERWIVEGERKDAGHNPRHMLGTRGLDKEFEKRGYLLNDPRARRRIKEFFSSNYGKAAIGHVHFHDRAKDGILEVETATGTTEWQLMGYKNRISTAFTSAGLPNPIIALSPDTPGMITIQCRGCSFSDDRGALEQLKSAFEKLRAPKVRNLVIAQAILDEEIQAQIKKAPEQSTNPGRRRQSPT